MTIDEMKEIADHEFRVAQDGNNTPSSSAFALKDAIEQLEALSPKPVAETPAEEPAKEA